MATGRIAEAVPDKVQSPAARKPYVPFRIRARPGDEVLQVTQIRSHLHLKPKQRGSVRALGLHGIGSANLQPDSLTTWGALRQLSRIISVVPGEIVQNGEFRRRISPMKTVVERYPDGTGTSVEVDDRSIAWIEYVDGVLGVTWDVSTTVSPRDAIQSLAPLVGGVSRKALADLVFADGHHEQHELSSDNEWLDKPSPSLRVAAIAVSETCDVVWQRPTHDLRLVEIAVVGAKLDRKILEKALTDTGSAEVAMNAKALVAITVEATGE